MGFGGKNPHVAKATAAEQKAQLASDEAARSMAWREAARHWERAAEKESMEKRAAEYTRNADAARKEADGESASESSSAPPPTPVTPPAGDLN